MTRERILLSGGVAVPVIYFGNLFVAEFRSPEVDPWSQLPSELGVAAITWAPMFNAGLIAVGIAAALGAVGLFLGLRKIGANVVLSSLASIAMTVAAFAMTMAGLFPLPNPLHYGFNVLPVGMLTPLLGALALGAAKDTGFERLGLVAGFVAIISIVVASETVEGLVVHANAGIWARGLAFIAFTTIACLCLAVMTRVPDRPR